ncbi:hypothetical protein [Rhodococcus artemisiae]|uniref:Uncharacterized protein n=1 Tax=Rhodococcus artemisiae TaxID=714159 RepID=A0ABU7L6B2_9NOCA|nr:hypothetical protein [Rhodococcus artemisiae]MEE2057090.1 hypothetical protein [Rhodococcus artemisiae]
MDGRKIRRGALALAAPVVLLTSFAPAASAEEDTTGSWTITTQRDTATAHIVYHNLPYDEDPPFRCYVNLLGRAAALEILFDKHERATFTGITTTGPHEATATCENEKGAQESIGSIHFDMPGPEHPHLAGTQHFIID